MNRFFLVIAGFAIGCVSMRERSARLPDPHIDRVIPYWVAAGETFQVQPNGMSAITVEGTNLRPGSRLRWDGRAIEGSDANGTRVSGMIRRELYAQVGPYPISVESPEGQLSNSLPFHVVSGTGPVPVIKQLYPAEFAAGKPFNVQPGGESALGLTGENFLPGAAIEIEGRAVVSQVGGPGQMSAIVPADLLTKPRRLRIAVRNRDGKLSAPAELVLK